MSYPNNHSLKINYLKAYSQTNRQLTAPAAPKILKGFITYPSKTPSFAQGAISFSFGEEVLRDRKLPGSFDQSPSRPI